MTNPKAFVLAHWLAGTGIDDVIKEMHRSMTSTQTLNLRPITFYHELDERLKSSNDKLLNSFLAKRKH